MLIVLHFIDNICFHPVVLSRAGLNADSWSAPAVCFFISLPELLFTTSTTFFSLGQRDCNQVFWRRLSDWQPGQQPCRFTTSQGRRRLGTFILNGNLSSFSIAFHCIDNNPFSIWSFQHIFTGERPLNTCWILFRPSTGKLPSSWRKDETTNEAK